MDKPVQFTLVTPTSTLYSMDHQALFIVKTIANLAIEKQHLLTDPIEIADAIWIDENHGVWLEPKQIGTIMNLMSETHLEFTPTMILKISHYLQQDIPKDQQVYPEDKETLYFRENAYLWAVASQFFTRHKEYEEIHYIT